MSRRTLPITYIATYLLAISAILLIVLGYYRSDQFPPMALFVGAYLVLLLVEPFVKFLICQCHVILRESSDGPIDGSKEAGEPFHAPLQQLAVALQGRHLVKPGIVQDLARLVQGHVELLEEQDLL